MVTTQLCTLLRIALPFKDRLTLFKVYKEPSCYFFLVDNMQSECMRKK